MENNTEPGTKSPKKDSCSKREVWATVAQKHKGDVVKINGASGENKTKVEGTYRLEAVGKPARPVYRKLDKSGLFLYVADSDAWSISDQADMESCEAAGYAHSAHVIAGTLAHEAQEWYVAVGDDTEEQKLRVKRQPDKQLYQSAVTDGASCMHAVNRRGKSRLS